MAEPVAVQQSASRPGLMGRMAQASTAMKAVAQYVISGVSPQTWFGPLQPLPPMAPESVKGRAFDYPFGYNLQYQPRSLEAIKFWELKQAAADCAIARLLIETRKDRMRTLDWVVRPRQTEPGRRPPTTKFQSQISEVTAFLKSPDKRMQWGQWVGAVLEQNLVIDAVSVYRRKQRNGKPFAWELIDGATISVKLDANGRVPLPPSPAYQQVLKGIPAANYTSFDQGELLYFPENPRADSPYGMSRIEQALQYVGLQVARARSQMGWYQEGNVPEGFIEAPEAMTLDQVRVMQNWWDSLVQGVAAIGMRRKIWWLPQGAKYTAMKEATLKSEFDEWVARVLCYAFSEDPTPFIRSVNRATAETAQLKAEAEGMLPSMLFVLRLVNLLIEMDFGYTDLEFAWDLDTEFDPAKKAVIDSTYVKAGIKSIDEARESLGLEVLGGAFAKPMALTGSGYMPVDPAEVSALMKERQPVIPAGPGGPGGEGDGEKKPGAPGKSKTPTTANGEGAAPDEEDGTDDTEKSITRPVLNAHELADWMAKAGIGGDLVPADGLEVVMGVGAEDPTQPSALYIDGGRRSLELLDDGRAALFFDSPELAARRQELELAGKVAQLAPHRPHVVLTTGQATLPSPAPARAAEEVVAKGEAGFDADQLRQERDRALEKLAKAEARDEKGQDDLAAKAADYGLKLHRLHERRDEACEKGCVHCTKAGRDPADAWPGHDGSGGDNPTAAYPGPMLLGAEEYQPWNNTAESFPGGMAWARKVTAGELSAAAAWAHPSPTQAQARAGNYRKGHFTHQGVGFTVENDQGGVRRGVGADGKAWEVTMPVPYGYAKGSKGADGDQVDCYFGPNPQSDRVWLVDQIDAATGRFDEHKTFVFFDSWAQAQAAYVAAFSDGKAHERLGHVASMTYAEFRAWLEDEQREPLTPTAVRKAGVEDEPRDGHGRWTSGGGGAANDKSDGRVRWQNANKDVLSSDTYFRADWAYRDLDRVWEHPNGSFEQDVYIQSDGKDAHLNFSGQVYGAFTPRRDEEDDDHPNVNRAVFDKVAERVKGILERHFQGAKISITPQEKYYVSADVTLPQGKAINPKYGKVAKAFNDDEARDARGRWVAGGGADPNPDQAPANHRDNALSGGAHYENDASGAKDHAARAGRALEVLGYKATGRVTTTKVPPVPEREELGSSTTNTHYSHPSGYRAEVQVSEGIGFHGTSAGSARTVNTLIYNEKGKWVGPNWERGRLRRLAKYDDDEARDERGRWTATGMGARAIPDRKPTTMTAGEVNRELDRHGKESSSLIDALIDAGRGHERPTEMRGKTDPMSVRYFALADRETNLRDEIEARTGTRHNRMPAGFKPREKQASVGLDVALAEELSPLALREKTVTVATGMHGHDLRGAEPPEDRQPWKAPMQKGVRQWRNY